MPMAARAATPARGVRAQAKPDPERYEWGALPALTFTSDIGFGFGAIASLARFSHGYKPYLWRLEVLWLMTVKGKPGGDGVEFPYHDDYIKLDLPGLLGGRLRLNLMLAFSRYTTSGYFGFGNAARLDKAARDANPRYHMVDRIYPTASAQARVRLADHLQLLLGAQFVYNWINPYQDSLFARDLQSADPATRRLLRGTDRFGVFEATVGLIFDSRDHEYMPGDGSFHEISWRASPGWAIGTDHAYGGLNITLRLYRALLGRYLTVAARLMADLLVGQPPYYELARHGGLFASNALGGPRAIRGVPLQRYHGKVKLFGNVELRSRFSRFSLFGQRFQLGAVAFFDAGRGFADWSATAHLDGDGVGLKLGAGAGLRLAWGETFIIRADVAYSPDAEPIGWYLDVNHIF
jgi:outer membrane protein assembly factor BamA